MNELQPVHISKKASGSQGIKTTKLPNLGKNPEQGPWSRNDNARLDSY